MGFGRSHKESEYYSKKRSHGKVSETESSGHGFVFFEWHGLPTLGCAHRGCLRRSWEKVKEKEEMEQDLGLGSDSLTWPSPCVFQRRRSAEDELAMRGFLQEGDLISVSFTLHSSICVCCGAGEWGLDCRSLTGETCNLGLDQAPRLLLQPVSFFLFTLKKN